MKDSTNTTQQNIDIDKILNVLTDMGEDIKKEDVVAIIEECMNGINDNEKSSGKDENSVLVSKAKEILEKKRFDDDLALIKSVYPQEGAESVWEFDEPFFSLMLTGIVDALTAYEAYISQKGRKENLSSAPEIGGVSTLGEGIKEFYSPKDVDRLTDKDYKDPKVIERVRKSMLRWR